MMTDIELAAALVRGRPFEEDLDSINDLIVEGALRLRKLSEECERLRELCGETIPGLDEYFVTTECGKDIVARLRAAAGEGPKEGE